MDVGSAYSGKCYVRATHWLSEYMGFGEKVKAFKFLLVIEGQPKDMSLPTEIVEEQGNNEEDSNEDNQRRCTIV